MLDTEGFILVGGLSSRMGEDKSRLRLDGQTFVERATRALSTITSRISVVGSRPGVETHGLRVVRDLREGLGALGGLHAALASCGAPWAAVVSCDLPFVTAGLFERLASLRGAGAEAVAPVQEDGRPQPLCAFYAVAPCLKAVEELIPVGELRPRVLLRKVQTRWVQFEELSDLEGARRFFENVNTPSDYEEARKKK